MYDISIFEAVHNVIDPSISWDIIATIPIRIFYSLIN